MAKQQDLAGSPSKNPNSEEFVVASPASFYLQNGLTAISNNTAIIPRDSAGNIVITENSIDNSLLIIEPTVRQINKQSFLNTVQTRFQYFSFPAIVFATGSFEPVPINLDDILIDPVYSRYKPSEPRKILTTTPSGILMDELIDGNPTQKVNRYFITKEIKRSGANLRFRIKLQHRFDTPYDALVGSVFFYISKTTSQDGANRTYLGPYYNSNFENIQQQEAFNQLINNIILNTKKYCQLGIDNIGTYTSTIVNDNNRLIAEASLKSKFNLILNDTPPLNTIYLTQLFINQLKNTLLSQNNPGLVFINQQINTIQSDLITTLLTQLDTYTNELQLAKPGQIQRYGVQDLYIDAIIPNSSFSQGDIFGITAVCNVNDDVNYHTLNSDTSYWSITNADKNVDSWNNLLESGSNAG
jgi:hypothetical protein